MRVAVIVDGCVPERCIDASVRGNLDGVARIAFQGDETETRAYMHVTPGMADDAMAEVASLIGRGRRDVR